jgi:hypothetical protein
MRSDQTSDGPGLDVEALRALGLLPKEVRAEDLSPATCSTCLGRVWVHAGQGVTLDLEIFQGLRLLSLHPCAHPIEPEDLDDPDWGWVP